MRYLILILTAMSVSACGMLSNVQKSPYRAAQPEVRDVPYSARPGDELRKKVMVLPFLDQKVDRSKNVVETARRVVVNDLLRTRQFVIVNNTDFPQDVKSYLKDSKSYDMAAIARVAKALGVSAVIEGKVMEIRAKRVGDEIGVFRKVKASVDVTIGLRVFGTKTGREILTTTRKATAEAETTRVAQDSYSDRHLQEDPILVARGVSKAFRSTVPLVVKAVEKLNWEGRVAMIDGDRIFVNAGRLSGIQVGDILKVVEEGDEVFDPETGTFLGYAPGRMKGTLEVTSYFGKDGSVSVIHSGSGFKENDRVELY